MEDECGNLGVRYTHISYDNTQKERMKTTGKEQIQLQKTNNEEIQKEQSWQRTHTSAKYKLLILNRQGALSSSYLLDLSPDVVEDMPQNRFFFHFFEDLVYALHISLQIVDIKSQGRA